MTLSMYTNEHSDMSVRLVSLTIEGMMGHSVAQTAVKYSRTEFLENPLEQPEPGGIPFPCPTYINR